MKISSMCTFKVCFHLLKVQIKQLTISRKKKTNCCLRAWALFGNPSYLSSKGPNIKTCFLLNIYIYFVITYTVLNWNILKKYVSTENLVVYRQMSIEKEKDSPYTVNQPMGGGGPSLFVISQYSTSTQRCSRSYSKSISNAHRVNQNTHRAAS